MNTNMLSLAMLLLLGIILVATAVPGVFIIDEDNYLVTVTSLRHGGFTVPGTGHLTPSRELLYFDPEPHHRTVLSTPVVSIAPPLYSFVALPFSYVGWGGLVSVNTISFLLIAFMLFSYSRRFAETEFTPWLACSAFLLGTYGIEYAQGVWPHMLSAALCTGSFLLTSKARAEGSFIHAGLAGLTVGIAVGVREQNIFVAACLGLGLLLFGRRKLATAAAFTAGALFPLAAIATINLYRIGIWHPFPKAMAYINEVSEVQRVSSPLEPLKVFWAKVVNYSSYGSIEDPVKKALFQRDAASGALLLNGIVKKAWLQSSPWIALALGGLLLPWTRRERMSEAVRTELRCLSLVVFPTLIMFAAAGFTRTDALCFNQRYFIELLPLVSIALALTADRLNPKPGHLAAGFYAGCSAVVLALFLLSASARYTAVLFVPLALGAAIIAAWFAAPRMKSTVIFSLVLGACVGWSLFIHIETDLAGSRTRRAINRTEYEALRAMIPDHSALFAYWGYKDAAGPLQLDRDIVILDPWADDGKDAPRLIDELVTQGRRVFVLTNELPRFILEGMVSKRETLENSEGNFTVVEILSRPAGEP